MAVIARTVLHALNLSAMPGFVRLGVGPTQAYTRMKVMGYGIRKKTFLNMFREETGRAKMRETFKFIRKDYAPDTGSFFPTANEMDTKYLYKMQYNVYDAEGNFIEKGYTSVMSDKRMQREVAEAEGALNMKDESPDRYSPYLSDFTLIEGFRSPSVK